MPRKTNQPSQPRRGAGPKGRSGTPADRLVRAWLDEDFDTLEDVAEELIAGGRDGVLLAARRKLAERDDDDAADEFTAALTEMAEIAEGQEGFDFAELVLLPVVTTGLPPDPALLANGLAASGCFPAEAEVAFAEGWRSAEIIRTLPPSFVRRVLLDIANGRAPADLPPSDTADMAEGGIVVLVGAVVMRTEPPQDNPDAGPEALAAADAAQESERARAFDHWRESLDPAAIGGALVLPFCSPSQLMDEIAALLEGADAEEPALEEIVDFIGTAREEAGGEEVVARIAPREGGLELTVLTRSGRELDSRVFGLEEGGPTAQDVRRVVEECVPVVVGTE
jgi:hypothetical protein